MHHKLSTVCDSEIPAIGGGFPATGLDALAVATIDSVSSSSTMTEEDITNLRTLRRLMLLLSGSKKNASFDVGGLNIRGLGKLQHLRRKLCISNLENVLDAEDAAIANLKGKRHLKELDLRWSSDTENSVHERFVLDQLHPHENVECLSICSYGGEGFPSWLGASVYSNISSLKLSGCGNCLSLPSLEQLTSLKDLSISDFGGLVDVGPKFYGSCSPSTNPFRSLIILKF